MMRAPALSFHDHTLEEWEAILQTAWLYLTPLGLVIATVILGVRIVAAGRWRSRMSRASFLLVLSYAVLMVRVFAREVEWFGSEASTVATGLPDTAFAAFYLFAAAYFLWALFVEWVLPFLVYAYLWIRRPPQPPQLGELRKEIADSPFLRREISDRLIARRDNDDGTEG